MADTNLIAASAGPLVDDDNPWPGMASYREADEQFFKGREQEIEELSRVVSAQRLTVLFGTSGLGKTSLLRAGLFPRLRRQNELPVYVRLDFKTSPVPLAEQVFAATWAHAEAAHVKAPGRVGSQGLWEYLHQRDSGFWSERHRLTIPVFVLDQFEEIFTLGVENSAWAPFAREFLNELCDLAEGRAPAGLRKEVEDDVETARQYDFSHHRYRVVLSLREDYLAGLEDWRDRMPSLVTCRYRLRAMNGEQALEVVDQTRGRLIDTEVARKVVRFTAGESIDGERDALANLQVDPSLLGLFCRELNDRRRASGAPMISEELVRKSEGNIVEGFYENCMRSAPPALRRFVEDQLVTGRRQRDSRALEDALVPGEVEEHDIARLVDARLLRTDERAGVRRIELTHDVLTRVVFESGQRRRAVEDIEKQRQDELDRLQEEKRLAEENAELQRLKAEAARAEEAERSSRTMRRLAIALVVVCVAAVGAASWAVFQWDRAIEQRQAAENALEGRSALVKALEESLSKQVAAATETAETTRALIKSEPNLPSPDAKMLLNRAETSRNAAAQALRIAPLTGYKIDIFYVQSSELSRTRAQRVQSEIQAAGFRGPLQLRGREAEFFTGGFAMLGLEIRFEEPSEREAAGVLKDVLTPSGAFVLRPVRNQTPYYLSIFVPAEG